MSISGLQLREAMGEFATGVTIITTRAEEGDALFGFTANAVTSVSLDPPLVLVCVGKSRYAHQILSRNKYFGINILSHTQCDVARRFASPDVDRFADLDLVDGIHQVPLIAGASGSLVCERTEIYEGGDHSIFLGLVKSVDRHSDSPAPLLFFRGGFCGLSLQSENQ